MPTITRLTVQEMALTLHGQAHSDRPWRVTSQLHVLGTGAFKYAEDTVIAIYVPSPRQSHKGSAGSLSFRRLLFVGGTGRHHDRNFQRPYLP